MSEQLEMSDDDLEIIEDDLCDCDDYTGPRSIADTLDELSKLYPVIPHAVRQFSTGAVRSKEADDMRHDLVSPIGLRRVAMACAEGIRKGYGAYNWEKGMPIHDILNHAVEHIRRYLSGDRSEDHLGHLVWNAMAACHSEELWPHLNVGTLRGPGCTPPESPILEVEL